MKCIVIGLGGIGSHLIEPLCRLLAFSDEKDLEKRIVLVDGDMYQEKNRTRQRAYAYANKAEATKEWLASLFAEDLQIEARPRFIDADNVFFIDEGDIVFLAVDNHATRKVLSEHLGTLQNALLVSGGNEEFDGNVQIYERRGGKDYTSSLTYVHPEIAAPSDVNPASLSCEELAQLPSSRQVLAVNNTIAAYMLNAFTLWLMNNKEVPYGEVYFNLRTGNSRAAKRNAHEQGK